MITYGSEQRVAVPRSGSDNELVIKSKYCYEKQKINQTKYKEQGAHDITKDYNELTQHDKT